MKTIRGRDTYNPSDTAILIPVTSQSRWESDKGFHSTDDWQHGRSVKQFTNTLNHGIRCGEQMQIVSLDDTVLDTFTVADIQQCVLDEMDFKAIGYTSFEEYKAQHPSFDGWRAWVVTKG